MATRTNRNPYMSANLGSGARTTTGGTYENPRLGIEDYTAFGRGVGSTLRAPEQKEAQQLEGGIDYFGADQDAILGGLEFKENSSLVKILQTVHLLKCKLNTLNAQELMIKGVYKI